MFAARGAGERRNRYGIVEPAPGSAVLRASGDGAAGLAGIVRFAILGLVLALGLSAMGIADDIVNMAFAFVFGAVAVAVALSFGLGGREAAGRQMEYWLARLRKNDKD